MTAQQKFDLTAEDIAFWYLRLNGFLTLKNYLVHGDQRGRTRTEIDVLGVRFQYRQEHLVNPMKDDDWIVENHKSILVFCEVKRTGGDFNDAWTNRTKQPMESFLALVGIISPCQWKDVANDLYEVGASETNTNTSVKMILMINDQSVLQSRLPQAKIIQIPDALGFIHDRFNKYHNIKINHVQWEPSGQSLWKLYEDNRCSKDHFISKVIGLLTS